MPNVDCSYCLKSVMVEEMYFGGTKCPKCRRTLQIATCAICGETTAAKPGEMLGRCINFKCAKLRSLRASVGVDFGDDQLAKIFAKNVSCTLIGRKVLSRLLGKTLPLLDVEYGPKKFHFDPASSGNCIRIPGRTLDEEATTKAICVHELIHAMHCFENKQEYSRRKRTSVKIFQDQEEQLTITGKTEGADDQLYENLARTELGLSIRVNYGSVQDSSTTESTKSTEQLITDHSDQSKPVRPRPALSSQKPTSRGDKTKKSGT